MPSLSSFWALGLALMSHFHFLCRESSPIFMLCVWQRRQMHYVWHNIAIVQLSYPKSGLQWQLSHPSTPHIHRSFGIFLLRDTGLAILHAFIGRQCSDALSNPYTNVHVASINSVHSSDLIADELIKDNKLVSVKYCKSHIVSLTYAPFSTMSRAVLMCPSDKQ
jgi:hypothetical protein